MEDELGEKPVSGIIMVFIRVGKEFCAGRGDISGLERSVLTGELDIIEAGTELETRGTPRPPWDGW